MSEFCSRDEFERALLGVFFFFFLVILVWVSRWFVCLDLSFWLGLDLVVAGVEYVVVDLGMIDLFDFKLVTSLKC